MEQENLTLPFEVTHSHRKDPPTSIDAALSSREMAERHRSAILGALCKSSPRPMAAEELAPLVRLSTLQVMKRLSDLHNDSVIRDSGQTHTNRSGRRATKWHVVPRLEA